MTFHLTFVHIIFSLVGVAEWPSFGKELLTRLTICSLFILTIFYLCILVITCFSFGAGFGFDCFGSWSFFSHDAAQTETNFQIWIINKVLFKFFPMITTLE